MTSPLREMVAAARAMARGDSPGGSPRPPRTRWASSLGRSTRWPRSWTRPTACAATSSRTPRTSCGRRSAHLPCPAREPRRRRRAGDAAGMSEMLEQVERLGSLVEQLLDLSKLESGAVPLELTTVPARSLLERLASDWREPAGERDVLLLTSTAPPDLELGVDEQRMGQVLSNLVGNAVRHSPEGGKVRVDVTARPDGCVSRSATRARASPRTRSSASSSASTAPTGRARPTVAVPVSASRSPAGSWSCTAARSTPSRRSRPVVAWSSSCRAQDARHEDRCARGGARGRGRRSRWRSRHRPRGRRVAGRARRVARHRLLARPVAVRQPLRSRS